MISPSSRVRLRGTDALYTVDAIYCTNALAPDWAEEWAQLTAHDGRPAFWLLCQLENVEEE